jgi:Domain of unknown function (DUF4124)
MRSLLLLAGLAVSLAAFSQEIYRWVDKDGIVHYSDQPGSDKAELITVVEPSTYESADAAPAESSNGGSSDDSGSNSAEANPYTSLAIVSPEPDQVFFGADAVVTVTADLSGTLQPDHQVVFFLNGNRRPAPGLSLDLSGLDRGTYFLRASVLDQNGKPLISSQQTTFHVRMPSTKSPQSPTAPPKPVKPPKPTPKPTPKPAPKPATG